MTRKNTSERFTIPMDRIEQLQDVQSWHVLDFIPFQPKSAEFLDFERFLETGQYVEDFSQRICFIALTLIVEREAEVLFLTESEAFFETHPELKPFRNLRQLSYKQLWKIIHDVIVNELSSVCIFFAKEDVLMNVDGALRVTLYNANSDFLHTVNLLAHRNGLFLKHHGSDGNVTLL